ncbi:hypothetical protein [Halobacillus mangrovi]|uniref:hypothetical protein n=1 Tax=Halobacillus mangrovi TaxID=402384 RepID=UPI0018DCBAF1|nr:hypothetical protein [Halobacillus mangrovi]
MVDVFLEFMLGPMRAIGDYYFEHQMLFNAIVIGGALYKLASGKKRHEREAENCN